MKLFRKSVSILLVALMVIGLAACGAGDHREPYVDEEKKVEGFVDKDGDFAFETVDWDGPKGYVIVIPDGNKEAENSAIDLQNFFKDTTKQELEIVSDKTAAAEKEILIGKTNRSESNKEIAEAELKVSVQGSKLVFDGGHDVTVDSAVLKYIRLAPEAGKAATFAVKTDFKSTRDGDYQYVWGDEFEGTDIDFTKWDLIPQMVATAMMEVSGDKETVYTEDGRINLVAQRFFNPEAKETQFKVPASLVTLQKMNFVYGYAEIRARVPFEEGVWPSYWAKSTDYLKGSMSPNYTVEFDVWEVFGHQSELMPCIHRWYKPAYDYYKIHNVDKTKEDTSYHGAAKWVFEDSKNLDNEYHIYGWEWTPTEHIVYVDGKEYERIDITKSFDKNPDTAGFHDPQYLIFNNHLYPQDLEGPTLITNNIECLPAIYSIDWFRLYQKPGVGELYVDTKVNSYPEREE